jgi:hypothetical protein
MPARRLGVHDHKRDDDHHAADRVDTDDDRDDSHRVDADRDHHYHRS